MENTKKHGSYYAVMPANVRYDKSINAQCKLLYAEITALSNACGYCFAKNSYFAELYGVDDATVSRWLKTLSDRHYITIDRKRRANGTYTSRKIYIVDDDITAAPLRILRKNAKTATLQKCKVAIKRPKMPTLQKCKMDKNDQIAKMQTGQKKGEIHVAKTQDSHFAILQDSNNILRSGLILKNDNDDDDQKRLKTTRRAREPVNFLEFEKVLDLCDREMFPDHFIYVKVRNTLIELINDGELDLCELTADDVNDFVRAVTGKRRITDMRAYLSKCIFNLRRENPPQLTSHYTQPQAEELWQKVLETLSLEVNSLSFDIWISPLKPVKLEDGVLTLVAPTEESRLEVERKYITQISAAAEVEVKICA